MPSLLHTLSPKNIAHTLGAFMLKYELPLFFVILIAGSYLRLVNLENTTSWFGDAGRDVLVAKHMALYRDNLFVAPDANGGMGVLINTPIYFWILASLWSISGSEYGVIFLFSIIGISNIIIAYIMSRQLERGFSALIFPFFVSISSFFVYASRNVWQPHLLPFFQMLSMLFLIRGLKTNTKYVYLSVQMAFLATHIHLSFAPLLLITIMATAYALYRKKHYMRLAYLSILIIGNIITWLLLLPRLSAQIHELVTSRIFPTFFTFTYENFMLLSQSLFAKSHGMLSSIVILLLPICVMYISLRMPTAQRVYGLILGTMLSSILALGGYTRPLYFHYLVPYYVLELMAFSYVFSRIRSHTYLFLFPLFVLLAINISQNNSATLSRKRISELHINQQIAKAILQINTSPAIILRVCLNNNLLCLENEAFTSSVWFYLEKFSGERLGTITNANTNTNNFIPFDDSRNRTDKFVICAYSSDECLNRMGVLPTNTRLLYSDGKDTTLFHIKDATTNVE